jgi:hypothetical protein
MSKSCQKVVKSSLNNIGKTIGQTLKTKARKPGKFERMVRRIENRHRIDQKRRLMMNLGIRRPYATSSHLVTKGFKHARDN